MVKKTENTTVSAFVKNSAVSNFDPSKFVKKADVVLPSLSIKAMKENDILYISVESEIRSSEQVDEDGVIKMEKSGKLDENGAPIMQPSMLHTVIATNLATGERGQMVCPTIVYRGLKEYATLNGLKFGLKKGRSLGANKANLWEVVELEEAE